MNPKTQVIIIYLLTILLSNCGCERELIDVIKFAPNDLTVNPYHGNEILKFVDNNNNVITYNGQFRKITTQKIDGCIECCEDYYEVDWVENTFFASDHLKSDLQVNILMNFDIDTKERKPSIFFAWNYYESNPNVSATTFAGFPVDEMKAVAVEYGLYRNSIMLRNKIYYEVYTSPGETLHPERLHADTLYYSISEGIIGLKLSDGNLWVKQ